MRCNLGRLQSLARASSVRRIERRRPTATGLAGRSKAGSHRSNVRSRRRRRTSSPPQQQPGPRVSTHPGQCVSDVLSSSILSPDAGRPKLMPATDPDPDPDLDPTLGGARRSDGVRARPRTPGTSPAWRAAPSRGEVGARSAPGGGRLMSAALAVRALRCGPGTCPLARRRSRSRRRVRFRPRRSESRRCAYRQSLDRRGSA